MSFFFQYYGCISLMGGLYNDGPFPLFHWLSCKGYSSVTVGSKQKFQNFYYHSFMKKQRDILLLYSSVRPIVAWMGSLLFQIETNFFYIPHSVGTSSFLRIPFEPSQVFTLVPVVCVVCRSRTTLEHMH